MQHEEFAEILAQQLERVSAVLGVKTDEYATEDQLHNIRMAAILQGESLPEAVAGMMVKHTVSIFTMVGDGEQHPESKWDEKITDHIIWLILFKAALVEDVKNPLDANATDILRAHADAWDTSANVEIDGHQIPVAQVLRYAANIVERTKPKPS